jgi:hypothetical protein
MYNNFVKPILTFITQMHMFLFHMQLQFCHIDKLWNIKYFIQRWLLSANQNMNITRIKLSSAWNAQFKNIMEGLSKSPFSQFWICLQYICCRFSIDWFGILVQTCGLSTIPVHLHCHTFLVWASSPHFDFISNIFLRVGDDEFGLYL